MNMKKRFDTVFKDFVVGGEVRWVAAPEVRNEEGLLIKPADLRPLTLRQAALTVLMISDPREKISGEEKASRFAVAMKVAQGKEDSLSIDELALIKKLIGDGYNPVVVGQAWELLEGGNK